MRPSSYSEPLAKGKSIKSRRRLRRALDYPLPESRVKFKEPNLLRRPQEVIDDVGDAVVAVVGELVPGALDAGTHPFQSKGGTSPRSKESTV